MKPTDILKEEHRSIERMLFVLEKAVTRLQQGEDVNPDVFRDGIWFIKEFADGCHHQKEEKLLFPAMVQKGFPQKSGPIGVMLHEHDLGRQEVAAMNDALDRYIKSDPTGRPALVQHTQSFIDLLRDHILKEDNILFAMADHHFSVEEEAILLKSFRAEENNGAACSTKQQLIELVAKMEKDPDSGTKPIRLMAFVLMVFSFMGGVKLNAQDQTPLIKVIGSVRVRSEADMRDFNQRTPANTFTLLRTRLGIQAQPLEDVLVFIQAQDSRLFGEERDVASRSFSTLADTKNLDMHQAFVEVKKLFADEISLRLGRMELAYSNERLLGAVGWNNVGRSFDGGVIRFDWPGITIDALAMKMNETLKYPAIATPTNVRYMYDAGYYLYGAYGALKGIENYTIDPYFLYQLNRNTTGSILELKRYTIGTYLKGKSNTLDYEAEIAYQGGTTTIGTDISAYLLSGALGYSFPDCGLSRVSLGYELLSGTPSGDSKFKSFDPTFHTGHKFYGFMDYFVNIPVNTSNHGLADLIARGTLSLSEKTTANIWLHHFSLAQSVNNEKTLGQEIDIVVQYRHNKNVSFEIGTSAFLPDNLMRQAFFGHDVALWGYLQTSVSF
ncbi:MAG TPA: alginate export family protein [Bacteroidota bacterium]